MDPRLPDGEGSDAFKLAEYHPSVKPAALSLAAAFRRRSHRRGGDSGPGAGGPGGSGVGGPGGRRPAERAPTAGSAMRREEGELDDVEKGGRCTASGDAGEKERGAFWSRRRSPPRTMDTWENVFYRCFRFRTR